MKRINDSFTKTEILGASDAYRKFNFQFMQLFNADGISRNDEEFEQLYVHDEPFEKQLNDFQQIPNSISSYVVGYTGIGKTTTIRYCFSIGSSVSSFIRGEQVVFPTFLDGYQVTNAKGFDITNRIAAVNTMLEEHFPDLRTLMKTSEGKEEFYRFIRRHTERALEGNDAVDQFDWDKETFITEKLKAACHVFGYQYYANQLKFYISKHYDELKELVIILDDIESLPDDFQEQAIESYLKLYECMKNTDYPRDNDYSVKLLISMRPHTCRRHLDSRRIESFGMGMPIIKENSVPLDRIFAKRFDYYTKRNPRAIVERESWEECKKALDQMNSQFEGQYMKMISKLCFYDVRKTLKRYAMIFANRFWIQNNRMKTSAFSVSQVTFNFDRVNIIRALACQENEVFFDGPDGVVRNVFYTGNTFDHSVLSLMILKYFVVKTKFDCYGAEEQTETLSDVIQFWGSICGDQMEKTVRQTIDYLFDIKVLRKSIRNSEEYLDRDDHTALSDDSVLYISPRGNELYEMLRRDSVYFEMLREDSWRDDTFYEFDQHSSNQLMVNHQRAKIYSDLLLYIEYLCEQEDDILNLVKTNRAQQTYVAIFGSESVCHLLWEGVYKSIFVTGLLDNDAELTIYLRAVEKKTQRLMRGF